MKIKIKRIIAGVIDFYIIGLGLILPLYFISDLLNCSIISSIISALSVILFICFYCKKDCIWGYESIGKKLLGLRIYSNGNRIKDKKLLKDRVVSTFMLFPLYPLHILIDNKSIGDDKYNTYVDKKINVDDNFSKISNS